MDASKPTDPSEPSGKLWYADGLQFACTGCGNCCTGGPGYIWMNETEIDRLASHLQTQRDVVLKQHCRRIGGQVSLKEKLPNASGEYDCTFLRLLPATIKDQQTVSHAQRLCDIYEVRPMQCRTWPFWQGNLATPAAWQRASLRCPGMNRGKKWNLAEIIARRDAK